MKKSLLAWALMVALLLCSCARTGPSGPTAAPSAENTAPAPSGNMTAGELAAIVVDSQSDKEDYILLPDEDIEFYVNQVYGLEGGEVTEAAIYTAGGVDAREIAVLRLSEGGDAEYAARTLDDYRGRRVGDFYGYDPVMADMVKKGRVWIAGQTVVLLICSDPESADRSLGDLLEVQGGPVQTPAPTPTPGPAVTVTPGPVSEPTPEPAAELNPGLDISAFVPFDPPNDVDMSLYDDIPIVRAWQTGDESGLDEKQAAILEKCREVFDEVITDGMTDFQKELALHDWLIDHGEYDHTHYDPRTPLGRPDNTNPYGMLIKGYGVCLGYAETFRLLMDLAGVECITVPGAAYGSSEDHAWNMVRLEGEWYCVDPTWDDSSRYRYFNVTSEYLRQTDHQWDYENTPEATATRFRWNGKGKLPE